MDKHTPTPWRIIKGDRDFAFNIVHDSENGGTAVVRDVLKKENAAFIVRAVNAHEELLVVIQNLLTTAHLPASDRRRIEAHNKAQQAIAKAEAK